MRCQLTYVRLLSFLLVLLLLSGFGPLVLAQDTNNDTNNTTNNNTNNTDDSSTTGLNGVDITPTGLVRQPQVDLSGRLSAQQAEAGMMSLSKDIRTPSNLRCVSLTALERELVRNQGVPTEEMLHLAGLTRISHVFLYPDSHEVVIAGPAEGWIPGPEGADVGFKSGLPTLELQDLVVALRTYPAEGSEVKIVGCTIDPTENGLAGLQQYLHQVGGVAPATQGQQNSLINGMVRSLGEHNVKVFGVPANTNFAQVMVAADYRMKLIGLGLENPQVKMVKYIDKATPNSLSQNALIRWYFIPDYECVRISQDSLGMELIGLGLKLVGEDQVVSASGTRSSAKKQGNTASLAFQKSFTENYSKIAKTTPVYAKLRNLTDMLIVAAFLQKENVYEKCAWNMDFLGSEEKFAVQTCSAPQKAESAVAAVWKQGKLITPIAGGVDIDPTQALDSEKTAENEGIQIAQKRESVKITLAEGQWWWDKAISPAKTR